MKIKHILFPIDFSDFSRALNPEVEWVAKRFDADVTLMHVVEIPVTSYGIGEAAVSQWRMHTAVGCGRKTTARKLYNPTASKSSKPRCR